MPCEYFLLIRRQRRPFLLENDDGLSLAGQYAGRGYSRHFIQTQWLQYKFAGNYKIVRICMLPGEMLPDITNPLIAISVPAQSVNLVNGVGVGGRRTRADSCLPSTTVFG